MESTLSLQFNDLLGEVGINLGYGRGAAFGDPTWDTRQAASLDSIVRSGLRQFYYPPIPYDWSFLRPAATAVFSQGNSTVRLPDDYGGLEGQITLSTTSSQPWRIEWTNPGVIQQQYAMFSSRTGPPMLAAELPLKGTTGVSGQRFELLLFPLADQNYTLQFTYYVNPDYLSGAFPYAYGGSQHAETILESCLAIAEQRLDDILDGPHSRKFQERLQASIAMDRKNKPQRLGYNADRSDRRDVFQQGDQHGWGAAATYNGASLG